MQKSGQGSSISSSSLVDLKAELSRKQEEFKKERLQKAAHIKRPPTKKQGIWSKQNNGVLQRAQRDMEIKKEEEDAVANSKQTLAAKAKLYDKMTSGTHVPEEDGSQIFLVDFQQKAINVISDRRREEQTKQQEEAEKKRKEEEEAEEERQQLLEPVQNTESPEEEWVDYTDSLGRSRRCLKKDLPHIQSMDKSLGPKKPLPDLLSADMKREMDRKEWEEEEQEAMNKPTGPVHYSDVLHNEIRTHGTAFYKFSQEESARKEEMENLQKLRQQTIDQREKKEQYKAKRKAILKARLAKVKHRKMVREGKDPAEMMEEEEEESDDEFIGPQPANVEPLVRDESLRPEASTREWDVGKKPTLLYDKWMEDRREERPSEFAPPSAYYEDQPIRAKAHTKSKPQPVHNKDKVTVNVKDKIEMGLAAIRSEMQKKKGVKTESVVNDDDDDDDGSEDVSNLPWPKGMAAANEEKVEPKHGGKEKEEVKEQKVDIPSADEKGQGSNSYEEYYKQYHEYWQYHQWYYGGGYQQQMGGPPQYANMPPPPSGAPPQYANMPPPPSGGPPQYANMPPHASGGPPQYANMPPPPSGAPPQYANMPPQLSGGPPQYASMPPPPSGVPPQQLANMPPPPPGGPPNYTSSQSSGFKVPDLSQPPPGFSSTPQTVGAPTTNSLSSGSQPLPPGVDSVSLNSSVQSSTATSASVTSSTQVSSTPVSYSSVSSTPISSSSVSSSSSSSNAPQPAHYSSAPQKITPKPVTKYIPLHTIPPQLPEPPGMGTTAQYYRAQDRESQY